MSQALEDWAMNQIKVVFTFMEFINLAGSRDVEHV